MSKRRKIDKSYLVPMKSIEVYDKKYIEHLKGIKLKDILDTMERKEHGYNLHEFMEKLNIKLATHNNVNMSDK